MSEKHKQDSAVHDALFREARSYSAWQDKEVSDETLQVLYDLVKWGPTSANCLPMRLIFVKSEEAKARLKPHLAPGNVDKTMSAPVTAIVAQDMKFYDHLPRLFPHTDARSWFVGKEDYIHDTAFRNASMQGGYLILAARSLGLDCGPMSGFDMDGVRDEFFNDEDVEPNFLCNLGYGDLDKLHPRLPRFDFDEVCKII